MDTQLIWFRSSVGILLVLAGGAAAAAPVSIYHATGSGFTSLDQGVTRTPLDIAITNFATGGKLVVGSGRQEIRNPTSQAIIAVQAGASGSAVAKPGSLGASAYGIASIASGSVTLGGHARALFEASSTEYIQITSSVLPVGTVVDFTASYHIDGITSSEIPGLGPYQYSGFPYPTGTFFFTFTAYTVNGATEAYNGDGVGSGTYFFPNGFATSISTNLNFGQSFNMSGKVGDYLVFATRLGLTAEDRAYEGYGRFQQSTLDFSHTVNLFADPITRDVAFVANGHNYTSVVPLPASVLLLSAGLSLLGLTRKAYGADT